MTAILEYLGVIGTWAIHRLPLISLELGVFALFIMVLLRLRVLRPARIQKWFWLVVLAKPMVMLIIISPLALNLAIFQDVPLSGVTLDSALSQPDVGVSGELPLSVAQTSAPTTEEVFQRPSFWSLVRSSLDWSHGLATLWISGFTFLCARALIGFRKLSKLRGQAIPLVVFSPETTPLSFPRKRESIMKNRSRLTVKICPENHLVLLLVSNCAFVIPAKAGIHNE